MAESICSRRGGRSPPRARDLRCNLCILQALGDVFSCTKTADFCTCFPPRHACADCQIIDPVMLICCLPRWNLINTYIINLNTFFLSHAPVRSAAASVVLLAPTQGAEPYLCWKEEGAVPWVGANEATPRSSES